MYMHKQYQTHSVSSHGSLNLAGTFYYYFFLNLPLLHTRQHACKALKPHEGIEASYLFSQSVENPHSQ